MVLPLDPRKVPAGTRIFTHIPKAGYVGVRIVTGEPMPFAEAAVNLFRRGVADDMQRYPRVGLRHLLEEGRELVVPVPG